MVWRYWYSGLYTRQSQHHKSKFQAQYKLRQSTPRCSAGRSIFPGPWAWKLDLQKKCYKKHDAPSETVFNTMILQISQIVMFRNFHIDFGCSRFVRQAFPWLKILATSYKIDSQHLRSQLANSFRSKSSRYFT